MAETFTKIDIHCIFSTRNRTDLIDADLKKRLYARMTEIANDDKIQVHAIGGTSDHIHMLMRMPADLPLATALRRIKSGSSKWHNETFRRKSRFYWHSGYAAASVSLSALEKNKEYILKQEDHHKTRSFKEEYILFLKKNGITYNEKYLWS